MCWRGAIAGTLYILALCHWAEYSPVASVQAQDKQGVAGSGPAVKTQGTEKPEAKGGKPDKSPAPTAAQQGGKRAPKGDPLTAKAEYYIREDLKAQRRMAIATEKLIKFTQTQTSLVRLEIWLLAGTLLATAIAAGAAALAARAANKAVNVSSTTAEAQLRAYVGVVQHVLEKNNTILTMVFKNGGQTPANNVGSHVNWLWYPSGEVIPDGFAYPDYNLETALTAGRTFIIPGETVPITFGVDGERFAEAAEGKVNLFLYGHIDYSDVFGESRATTFCYRVIPSPTGGGGTLIGWREHNECR